VQRTDTECEEMRLQTAHAFETPTLQGNGVRLLGTTELSREDI